MRTVLILAYYFPPIGGAGVQNTLKLVRQLPAFGYQPVVITGPGGARGRWAPRDESLQLELDAHTQVERVLAPEPSEPSRRRGRADRWLRYVSHWDRWWVEGVLEAAARVSAPEIVFASMSPYSTARAAAALSGRFSIPWIAGLRDPWALDEMMVYPSRLHRHLEMREMSRILRTASAVVMNTNDAARSLITSFPEFGASSVHVVTNGYDGADFAASLAPRTDGRFRLTHTGYLHTAVADGTRSRLRGLLGGAVDRVDTSTRSHVYVLQAVNKLLERRPELANVLDVCFAGVLTDEDEKVIRGCPVARSVGYLSHAESVALVRSSNLLFLPMHDLPPGRRATIVPGKTYEYLAAGVPILGAVPDGDARDLLARSGNAVLCRPRDVGAMERALEQAVQSWSEGSASPPVPSSLLHEFERRKLARDVAAVLDAQLAASATR